MRPGASPKNARGFHVPPDRARALDEIITDGIRRGWFEEVKGPAAWCSPGFVVPKKSPGSWRLVIDFRALNEAVVEDAYPMPVVEEMLQPFHGCAVFSVLGMSSAFHQIVLQDDCRDATCFRGKRCFRYCRSPMGLKTSPAMLQRIMDRLLAWDDNEAPLGVRAAYMDDCLVGTPTLSSRDATLDLHFRTLSAVLSRFASFGFGLQLPKCAFFHSRVLFGGHILEKGSRRPDPEKSPPSGLGKGPCQ